MTRLTRTFKHFVFASQDTEEIEKLNDYFSPLVPSEWTSEQRAQISTSSEKTLENYKFSAEELIEKLDKVDGSKESVFEFFYQRPIELSALTGLQENRAKITEVVEEFLGKHLFKKHEKEVLESISEMLHVYTTDGVSLEQLYDLVKDGAPNNQYLSPFFSEYLESDQTVEESYEITDEEYEAVLKEVRRYIPYRLFNENRKAIERKIEELLTTYLGEQEVTAERLIEVLSSEQGEDYLYPFFHEFTPATEDDVLVLLKEYVLDLKIMKVEDFHKKESAVWSQLRKTMRELLVNKSNTLTSLRKYLTQAMGRSPSTNDEIYQKIVNELRALNTKQEITKAELIEHAWEVLKKTYGIDKEDYQGQEEAIGRALDVVIGEFIEKSATDNNGIPNLISIQGAISEAENNASSSVGRLLKERIEKVLPNLVLFKDNDDIDRYSQVLEESRENLREYVQEKLTTITGNTGSYAAIRRYIESYIITPIGDQIERDYSTSLTLLSTQMASPSGKYERKIDEVLNKLVSRLEIDKRLKSHEQKNSKTVQLSKLNTKLLKDYITWFESLSKAEKAILLPGEHQELNAGLIKKVKEEFLQEFAAQILRNSETLEEAFERADRQGPREFVSRTEDLFEEGEEYQDAFEQRQDKIFNRAQVTIQDRATLEGTFNAEIQNAIRKRIKTLTMSKTSLDKYKESARELITKKWFPEDKKLTDLTIRALIDTNQFGSLEERIKEDPSLISVKLYHMSEMEKAYGDEDTRNSIVKYLFNRKFEPKNTKTTVTKQDKKYIKTYKTWEDLPGKDKSHYIKLLKKTSEKIPVVTSTDPEINQVLLQMKGESLGQAIANISSRYYGEIIKNNLGQAMRELMREDVTREVEKTSKDNYDNVYYQYLGHAVLPWEVLGVPLEKRQEDLYTDDKIINLLGLTPQLVNRKFGEIIAAQAAKYNNTLRQEREFDKEFYSQGLESKEKKLQSLDPETWKKKYPDIVKNLKSQLKLELGSQKELVSKQEELQTEVESAHDILEKIGNLEKLKTLEEERLRGKGSSEKQERLERLEVALEELKESLKEVLPAKVMSEDLGEKETQQQKKIRKIKNELAVYQERLKSLESGVDIFEDEREETSKELEDAKSRTTRQHQKIDKVLRDYPEHSRAGQALTSQKAGIIGKDVKLYYDVPEELQPKGGFVNLQVLMEKEQERLNEKFSKEYKEYEKYEKTKKGKKVSMPNLKTVKPEHFLSKSLLDKLGDDLDLSRIYKRQKGVFTDKEFQVKNSKGKLTDPALAKLSRSTEEKLTPLLEDAGQKVDERNIVWSPTEGWVGTKLGLERSFRVSEYSTKNIAGTGEPLYPPGDLK